MSVFSFKNAVLSIFPQSGITNVTQLLELGKKLVTRLDMEPQTEEFFAYFFKSLAQFNIHRFYFSRYLTENSNLERVIAFYGQAKENSYEIGLENEPPNQTLIKNTINTFADNQTQIALKRNKGSWGVPTTFGFKVLAHNNAGAHSYRNVLNLLHGLLKTISPSNIDKLHEKSQEFSHLNENSSKLFAMFQRDLPKTSGLVLKYIKLREIVPRIKQSASELYLCYSIDYQAIARDFHRTSAYLHPLHTAFKINLQIKTTTGLTITDLWLHEGQDSGSMRLFTRDGQIIPYDTSGNLVYDEAFELGDLKQKTFYNELAIYADILGLKFETTGIIIDAEYATHPNKGKLNLAIKKIPETTMSGSVLNVLPTWFIKFVVPVNIDKLIYKFNQAMVNAAGGQGSFTCLSWDTSDPDNINLTVDLESEFLDNFFIKFAMKVASIFTPSKDTGEEINELLSLILDALKGDVLGMGDKD